MDEKKEKIKKLRRWFEAYKSLFDQTFDDLTVEQITVYNEFAEILGVEKYTKPVVKYERVKNPKTGEIVMRKTLVNVVPDNAKPV